MEITSKKWYHSRLVWVGVGQVIVAVLALLEVLTPGLAVQISAVSGAVVVLLRTLTSLPVTK